MSKKENALVKNENLPTFLQGNGGQRRGTEDVGADDIVIPRLELVQALSPCRKKNDPAYIDGAEEGLLFNSLTRELYGSAVEVIPVKFRKEYLIWKDRKKGGGFRGSFPTELEAEQARRQLEDGEDCEVLDTGVMFCLRVDGGRLEEIVVSMAKSRMKTARKWNSLIRLTQHDSFAKRYEISAVQEKNSNGDDYWNIAVKPLGFVDENQYKSAEELYRVIESGGVVADRSQADEPASGGRGGVPEF
jgi:hypothetical protein